MSIRVGDGNSLVQVLNCHWSTAQKKSRMQTKQKKNMHEGWKIKYCDRYNKKNLLKSCLSLIFLLFLFLFPLEMQQKFIKKNCFLLVWTNIFFWEFMLQGVKFKWKQKYASLCLVHWGVGGRMEILNEQTNEFRFMQK